MPGPATADYDEDDHGVVWVGDDGRGRCGGYAKKLAEELGTAVIVA